MTREEITRMAQEAGFVGFDGENKCLREFAALVAAAEREACAKASLEQADDWRAELDRNYGDACMDCAAAIRARGQA